MKPSFGKLVIDLFLHLVKRYLMMVVFVTPFILFLVFMTVFAEVIAEKLGLTSEHTDVIIILGAMLSFFGLMWLMIKGQYVLPKKFDWWFKWSKNQVLPKSIQDLTKRNDR